MIRIGSQLKGFEARERKRAETFAVALSTTVSRRRQRSGLPRAHARKVMTG
jgi:hypothetical protein